MEVRRRLSTSAAPRQRELLAQKSTDHAAPPSRVEWTGWRGSRRDGHSAKLPDRLPEQVKLLWEAPLGGPGLGGIAATRKYVVFGDRDLDDQRDVFYCFDAELGIPLWLVEYQAAGKLDYGNTPRATPLIHGEHVFLMGAFGDLRCVQLEHGKTIWKTNLRTRFHVQAELPWGYCGSPLLVDDRLIVNPGAADASLIALDPRNGNLLWKTSGPAPGYGSMIVANCGGARQIVGHDATSLGGWEIATGKRLWKLEPAEDGDFNVPTPINVDNRLLVATENNGTRMYEFDNRGMIKPDPVAENLRMSPDMSSPVVVGDLLFCVDRIFYCLNLNKQLQIEWKKRDRALSDYASIIADQHRLLVVGSGELLLVEPTAKTLRIVSRLTVFDDGAEIYAHPALVGDRLYIRGETSIRCIRL